jgi:hypothetical protein
VDCVYIAPSRVSDAHELGSEKITVRTVPVSGAYSWNVKPRALLQLLNEANQEVGSAGATPAGMSLTDMGSSGEGR